MNGSMGVDGHQLSAVIRRGTSRLELGEFNVWKRLAARWMSLVPFQSSQLSRQALCPLHSSSFSFVFSRHKRWG